LEALYQRYKAKGLVVLGVNVQWDKEQLMRTFLEVYKTTYPVGRDGSGAIGAQYQIDATPTSLFIDKAGRLAEQHVGELEEGDFSQRIDEMLKAKYPEATKVKPKAKPKATPKVKPKAQPKKQPTSKPSAQP
jgi:hypothetical protein